jgi:hypothetical protein
MTSSPKGNRVRQTGATKKCEFPLRHRPSSREAHVRQREKLQLTLLSLHKRGGRTLSWGATRAKRAVGAFSLSAIHPFV